MPERVPSCDQATHRMAKHEQRHPGHLPSRFVYQESEIIDVVVESTHLPAKSIAVPVPPVIMPSNRETRTGQGRNDVGVPADVLIFPMRKDHHSATRSGRNPNTPSQVNTITSG